MTKKYQEIAASVVKSAGQEDARFDASYGRFIEQMLETVESGIYKTTYQDLKFREWLPAKTDIAEGADMFAYYILNQFGEADFISSWSDEIKVVNVQMEKRQGQVYAIADAYVYSEEELAAAAFARVPLSSEFADTAARAIEQKLNDVVLLGNAPRGLPGFFVLPGITTLTSAADFDSGATTGDAMLAELRRGYNQVKLQSQGKFTATQVILPLSTYLQAESKPVNTAGSGDGSPTVLQAFIRGAGTSVSVGWDISLEAAGVGATKRAIFYQRDQRVAQYVEPQPVKTYPPFRRSQFVWQVAMKATTGGTILRQPQGIVYTDGF